MGALDDFLDETPDNTVRAETRSTPTAMISSSAIDSFLDEDRNALQYSVRQGTVGDSGKSIRILQAIGRTRLPREFVERNLEFVESETAKQEFDPDRFLRESPVVAEWLKDPVHAAAVRDDYSRLSYLERQYRYIGDNFQRGNDTVELSDLGQQAMLGTLTSQQRARQAELEKALAKSSDQGITGFFEQIPGAAANQIPIFGQSITGKVKAAAEGTVIGAAAGAAAGAATANPALPAAGATLGAITGWRYGAAIEAGKMEAALAYLDYEKLKDENGQPLDRQTVLGLAGIVGVVNGALEGLTGLERAADKLPWVRSLSRDGIKQLLASPSVRGAVLNYARTVGTVMVEEGVTEGLQSMVTAAGKVLAKSTGGPTDILGEIFSPENLSQAVQEARAGAQGGGGLGAVTVTPTLLADIKQAKQAKQNEQAFLQMGEATKNAAAINKLPDHLQQIIQKATEGGPVDTLYIPTESFNTYFQSKGVDPRQVAEALGDVEAYDQATATGQDLPIKTAVYAAKLAGTDHNAFFARELKTSREAMNAREAEEWSVEQDKLFEEQTKQAGAQVQSATDPLTQIRTDITNQLSAAGFNPDAIGPFAEFFAQRYQARAERRGLGEDAAELFGRVNLQIVRNIPDILRSLQPGSVTRRTFAGKGYDEAAPFKPHVNSPGFSSKQLADIFERESLSPKGDRLISIPSFGEMVLKVRRAALKDPKILDAIVSTVPVDVVNDLFGSQSAAKIALHNESMFKDSAALDADLPISDPSFASSPIGLLIREAARVAAKLETVAVGPRGETIESAQAPNTEEPTVFNQAAPRSEKDVLASIDLSTNIITLFDNANFSSLIHESGHLYLNELIDDATTEGTAQQLRDDLDTLLKWFGLEVTSASGKDAIKAAIQTDHHEQFARGFEAYAMEGKAPSVALRETFARFRQWLIQIYRSLVNAALGVKINKDVRAVMDRMLATDEAIDAAAEQADVLPAFTDKVSAGMSEAQWNVYQDLVGKASLTARERLQAKLMRQLQREKEEWWKTERAKVEQEVTAEINDLPDQTAVAVLKTGKLPDGSDLPDGIQPFKLDRKTAQQIYGKELIDTLPKGVTGKDGMHPDAAAQLFGYTSGQELVLAVANARPKAELIEAETDRRMREAHGDILTDGTIAQEAQEAVLNEHQDAVVQAELKAIAAKRREVSPFLNAAQQEAEDKAAAGRELLSLMVPTLEHVRALARGILAKTAIQHITPHTYIVTARKASRQATAAIAKQNWVKAGYFKQQELLNLALFREAGIIKEQVEKTEARAKDFFKTDEKLAKSRNVDLVNIGRAILSQFGFGSSPEKTAAEYLEQIQRYDQDLYDQWAPQVAALAPRQVPYQALTVQEFTKLAEDMEALWHLSRRTQQAMIDGKMVDRQDILDQLSARLNELRPGERKAILGDLTASEDAKLGLVSWKSALRRVESWVDAMDGGNQDGVFRRYIWTPISEASVLFRSEKSTLMRQYLELVKGIEKTMTFDLIPAPELGAGAQFRGKPALLHAILHTGNASNKDKLLRGYGWTADQWQAFTARAQRDGTLTKADYDFAQGVWDLLESIKPQAQKAHHEMYGYYFNEITAEPVSTQWGEYRGGYVPAIADANQSVEQAIRQEKELFDQGGNSFMFPTTGRGFTKARVEQYTAPLMLNLRAIPIHFDKVMRFVHLEPRVKDAARIITNKGFRKTLDNFDPSTAKDMLVPWLQRSAQQTVSTPGKNRHADRLFRYLRNSVGAQIMVANVVNTLQQFTGFSLSLTKVKAKYLRHGLVRYLTGPGSMAEDIHAKSPFMAQRSTTQVMEIQATIDDITLNPTKYERAANFAKRHGYFMQQGTQNIVDLITWSGAYDQAMQKGASEKEAVREADATVRQTQGSFDPESLSAFEAGTPFTRAFTMFYSYFNMQANLLGTEFAKVAQGMGLRKGAGRAFYLYLVGFMIPAVLAEIIVRAAGGFDADDEDEYLNESLSVFFLSQIRTAFAMVPGVGPAILAGINAFNNKWYDDRISTSPVVSTIESAVRAPHSVYAAMAEDGHSKRAIKDTLSLVGLVTGLPVSALGRPAGYLADVADGVAQPENALDVGRGLFSGKDVNRKQ